MMKDKIYGVRDPYGNRPLCIGKIVPVDLGKRKFYYHTIGEPVMCNVTINSYLFFGSFAIQNQLKIAKQKATSSPVKVVVSYRSVLVTCAR